MAEFNMVNLAKKEPRWDLRREDCFIINLRVKCRSFKNLPEKKKRGDDEILKYSSLALRKAGQGPARWAALDWYWNWNWNWWCDHSMSECGQAGGSRRQICVTHSLVITDKSNSEPAGGHSSHIHHGGICWSFFFVKSLKMFLTEEINLFNYEVRFCHTGKQESLWTTEDKYLTEDLLCQNIWRVLTPLLWILSYHIVRVSWMECFDIFHNSYSDKM